MQTKIAIGFSTQRTSQHRYTCLTFCRHSAVTERQQLGPGYGIQGTLRELAWIHFCTALTLHSLFYYFRITQ